MIIRPNNFWRRREKNGFCLFILCLLIGWFSVVCMLGNGKLVVLLLCFTPKIILFRWKYRLRVFGNVLTKSLFALICLHFTISSCAYGIEVWWISVSVEFNVYFFSFRLELWIHTAECRTLKCKCKVETVSCMVICGFDVISIEVRSKASYWVEVDTRHNNFTYTFQFQCIETIGWVKNDHNNSNWFPTFF